MSGTTNAIIVEVMPAPAGQEVVRAEDPDQADISAEAFHADETSRSDGDAEGLQAAAWAFLRKWNLSPRPYAYEVAYLYVEGENPDNINRPIDDILKKSNGLCDYDVQQIHAAMRGGAERDVWERLKQEFLNVASIIERQTDSSSKHSRSLLERRDRIASVSTIDQFREMISGLVRENERILTETQSLRMELKSSSQQINDLRSKLVESRDKELQDPLTRIGNRRYFDEWMEKEHFAALRDDKPLCLAIADLDHFKKINDTYGHPVGDAVLCFLVQLFRSNLKGRDRIARYGGEEFAVILPETRLRAAVKLIDKIRRDLHARNIVIVEDQMDIGKVTASFGVAELQPDQSVEALLKQADAKLYEAKHAGRNCVRF